MFETVRALSEGPKFHIEGIRFAFKHPSFLALAALPFVVTLSLYAFGFHLLNVHVDTLLNLIWHVEPGESSRVIGWLYWAYMVIVKFFVYFIVLAVMFYSFIVFANVLASPVYDHISEKYERLLNPSQDKTQVSSKRGILTIMKEEAKKAVFMLLIPLLLIFIPVVGSVLGIIVASIFIAWDYVDFSLSRDCPLFRDRMRALWHHKFRLMGFGFPLLVPFLGIIVLPFAIIGSTKLYYERMVETSS